MLRDGAAIINETWIASLSLSLSQSAPLFNTKVPLSINIYTKQKYLPLDHKWTLKTATNTKTTKTNFCIKTVVVCKFVKYQNFFNSKTVFPWVKSIKNAQTNSYFTNMKLPKISLHLWPKLQWIKLF